MRRTTLAALLFWCLGQFALAQAARSVGPEQFFDPKQADAVAPSLKLRAGAAAGNTEIRLGAAKAHEKKSLEEFNSANRHKVLQIGFRRLLADSASATFSASALEWTALPDGGHAAQFTTASPEAAALRLGFAITRMDNGVELRFFGSADPGRVYGPITNRDIHRPDPIYWTPVIEGDALTTEIYLPPGLAPDSFAAELPEVSHLVATASGPSIVLKGIGDAGACEHDLACTSNSEALLAAANSVARMIFTESGGSYACTGTLLNDSVPSTFVPYFYTANHCISTQTVANTLNTYWFFQALTCGAGTAPNSVQRTGGAVLLHHDGDLDSSFLRLNDAPPGGAVFAGWDAGLVTAGAAATAIHHPRGDLKKLSLGNIIGYQPYNGAGSFIFAGWTYGVTEGGSSGSGLFTFDGPTSTYRLRGGLKGGTSSCDRLSGTDGYSRLDQVYPFIQQYLDPAATVCNSSINPASQSVPAAGVTASVTVTNGTGCNWTAISNASWLTISSGSSGSGNGTVTYVAAVNTNASSRTGTLTIAGRVFTVTQAGASGGGAGSQLLNPGFESGATGWTEVSGGGYAIIYRPDAGELQPHTGNWLAWLGGYTSGTDKLYQDVAIPTSAQQAYVRFWYFIGTQETTTTQIYDTIDVDVYSVATGTRLANLARYTNLDRTNGWVQSPQFDLWPYRGQTVRLQFTVVNDSSEITNLFLDDVTFVSSGAASTSVAASVLPSSRSVQVGATATVFATVINTGAVDAVLCGIAPITAIPATFGFQATNPATNAPVGAANAKFTIPAHQAQSFVLSVKPTAAFASTDLQLDFSCSNAPNQTPLTGLNTLLISASATPVPDIVALAAAVTPGVLTLPGPSGAGAFAVATVNVGATGSITATADTGSAALPITLFVCQSNPLTGACLADPAASATTTINAGATPTFSIFGTARGAIAFDPANARVFVRFKDGAGVTRGSTSVAVRTQ